MTSKHLVAVLLPYASAAALAVVGLLTHAQNLYVAAGATMVLSAWNHRSVYMTPPAGPS